MEMVLEIGSYPGSPVSRRYAIMLGRGMEAARQESRFAGRWRKTLLRAAENLTPPRRRRKQDQRFVLPNREEIAGGRS